MARDLGFESADLVWTPVTISDAIREMMETYAQHSPRTLQSESCSGPLTLALKEHQPFQYVRDALQKEDFSIPYPLATNCGLPAVMGLRQ
jgi:hypothetical protein